MSLERITELMAQADRAKAYSDRAKAIVDRLLPLGRTPHGFYEREATIEHLINRSCRNRLQLYLAAKLKAKAEGIDPEIRLPRNAEHIFKPGDAIVDVAAFIDAQRAAA